MTAAATEAMSNAHRARQPRLSRSLRSARRDGLRHPARRDLHGRRHGGDREPAQFRRLRQPAEASLVGGRRPAGGAGLCTCCGRMPAGYPLNRWTVVGGAMLGLGAYVNRACVFGAIARLGSGEVGLSRHTARLLPGLPERRPAVRRRRARQLAAGSPVSAGAGLGGACCSSPSRPGGVAGPPGIGAGVAAWHRRARRPRLVAALPPPP